MFSPMIWIWYKLFGCFPVPRVPDSEN